MDSIQNNITQYLVTKVTFTEYLNGMLEHKCTSFQTNFSVTWWTFEYSLKIRNWFTPSLQHCGF